MGSVGLTGHTQKGDSTKTEENLQSAQARETGFSRNELGGHLGQGGVAHAHRSSIWEVEAEGSV